MAKGYERNQERLRQLSTFGRELVRRSRSACELCGTTGAALEVFEVAPGLEEPSPDRCAFLCPDCREQIEHPKRIRAERWRCLEGAVWSDLAPVQVLALRLLRHLAPDQDWAQDALEQAAPDPEVETWANAPLG